jgi:hypothetical protein
MKRVYFQGQEHRALYCRTQIVAEESSNSSYFSRIPITVIVFLLVSAKFGTLHRRECKWDPCLS